MCCSETLKTYICYTRNRELVAPVHCSTSTKNIYKVSCMHTLTICSSVINTVKDVSYPFLQYILETYSEARSTGYKYEPYRGGSVDGPQNGSPPLPWQIMCVPDQHFQNQTKKIEVPHTATVQVCHRCPLIKINKMVFFMDATACLSQSN